MNRRSFIKSVVAMCLAPVVVSAVPERIPECAQHMNGRIVGQTIHLKSGDILNLIGCTLVKCKIHVAKGANLDLWVCSLNFCEITFESYVNMSATGCVFRDICVRVI